jgi:hypothetical protein
LGVGGWGLGVGGWGLGVGAGGRPVGRGRALGSTGTDPCSGCDLTVSNSLGSSATVPLILKY